MDSVINLLNNQGLVCHWLVIATFFSFVLASFFFIHLDDYICWNVFLVVINIFIHENKPRNASVHTGAGLLFMHVDVNSQREHCKLQGNSYWLFTYSKASSRLYIIRIRKYYGYSIENLDLLFQSLILSVFTYAIEVWGCAIYTKYLSRIDKLFARCYKLGYCLKQYSILDIRRNRNMKLWPSISSTNTALSVFFTSPENTADDILPNVRTSRYKLRKHSARACPI